MLGDGYVSEAHCAKVRMGGGGGEQWGKNLFILKDPKSFQRY